MWAICPIILKNGVGQNDEFVNAERNRVHGGFDGLHAHAIPYLFQVFSQQGDSLWSSVDSASLHKGGIPNGHHHSVFKLGRAIQLGIGGNTCSAWHIYEKIKKGVCLAHKLTLINIGLLKISIYLLDCKGRPNP